MDNLEIYNNEIEKIKSIINKPKKDNSIVSILLFRNYLTKLFVWKKNLGNDSEFIKSKESHNLFPELDSNWLDKTKTLNEFNHDLKNAGLKINSGKFFDDIFLYLVLNWNIYKHSSTDLKNELESPYDSLSKILERTLNISIINGQFQIGNITFNNREKYKNFILPSLDDRFLEYVETNTNQKPIKIPNQIEINELWDKFNEKL
jgi:hypothetical protein